MAFRGIDIREAGDRILFRAFFQDGAGALETAGTVTLKLYKLQNDGTLLSYDFNDNTFKAGALTTETQTLTHRQGNNSTTDTGLWTYALTTLTGFTAGNIYFALVNDTLGFPTDQMREFQFGSGVLADLMLSSGTLSEIVDVTDIPAEPTPFQSLMLLYQWLRNATQVTETERRVFNDAGVEVLDATCSDAAGVFDQGKLGNP